MIDYADSLRVIALERGDAVAVSTMTQMRHWNASSTCPELDIGISNGMSKASSVGLGIAIGAPDRKVLVMDGDGSLLMNLGTLVTVATESPANFYHFVFENGVYAITGGQPTPGVGVVDFAGLAIASGYRSAHKFDDLEHLASDLPGIMSNPGPTMIVIKSNIEVPATRPVQTWESNARMPAGLRSVKEQLAKR
jgi:phosphonopyruvate decarboxylase